METNLTQRAASEAVKPTSTAIEQALILGNLGNLTVDQRLSYYKSVCESVGLNPLTRPFDYLNLNGKLVLYAKRDATDQLRKIHGVSVYKLEKERIEDVYIVTAYVRDKSGREDSSTGAVTVGAIKGDSLANALMKAETKAKRRATLSICGLGMLDETEVSTIPSAHYVPTMDELKAAAEQFEHESENRAILEKAENAPLALATADVTKPKGKCITAAQRSRLFAIGKEHGWNETDLRNLLGKYGFEHSNEITLAKYDEIIKELSERSIALVSPVNPSPAV